MSVMADELTRTALGEQFSTPFQLTPLIGAYSAFLLKGINWK